MKLSIRDKEYDWAAAVNKASLQDLLELSEASGIGVRSILTGVNLVLNPAKTEDRELIVERPDVIKAMLGLVFLCYRKAGERIAYADMDVAFSDLTWLIEESDVIVDPTQASGDQTQPEPETPSESNSTATRRSRTPSKTSKSPSITTS